MCPRSVTIRALYSFSSVCVLQLFTLRRIVSFKMEVYARSIEIVPRGGPPF